jgi:prepilin-type processing-associated H-X9-DG protein
VPPLKKTTEIPIIFDAVWPTAWPKDPPPPADSSWVSEGPPGSLYAPAGGPPMAIGNNWTRVVIARHNMAINVGFMDGHATTVDLPQLWFLKWHGPASGPLQWNPPTETTNPKFSEIKKAIRDAYKG